MRMYMRPCGTPTRMFRMPTTSTRIRTDQTCVAVYRFASATAQFLTFK